MNTNANLSTIILLVVLLAACAPAAIPTEQPAVGESRSAPATEPAAVATAVPTQPGKQSLPVPTARGDALVATDPATVNLKSGTPTLLEFFRFT